MMRSFLMAGGARAGMRVHFLRLFAVLALLAGVLAQIGCRSVGRAAPSPVRLPPPPARIAFLPLNVPPGGEDLHWIAVAAAVAGAEMAQAVPDLEPVPLWESMPAAIQSLGNARAVTAEIALTTSSRLSARWLVGGEVRRDGSAITMRLDFIPSKPTLLPFRYEKPVRADKMNAQVKEAYQQFLRFLMVRKLQQDKIHVMGMGKLKSIAEAVDAEYGWYASKRKPGGSQTAVEDLMRGNPALARLLFNPDHYTALGK